MTTLARATGLPPEPEDLDPSLVRRQVATVLDTFLDAKKALAQVQGLPLDVPLAVAEFLNAGGKRIRPLLCVLGWHAAGGAGPTTSAVQIGASLEMFHAFCLIHDDVMDHSDTRRGRPTVHRSLAGRHRPGRTAAAADDVGVGAAILAGDLALIWADELIHRPESGLDPDQRRRVVPLVDLMRTEVLYGQYLDLSATGRPSTDLDQALAIVRNKTAKYTTERPLQIGAALAGADDEFLSRLSDFALPLGEAFQFRDDLLGTFGDQTATGKPALDDLREGKHTVLVALALRAAEPTQARTLRALYGHPHLGKEDADTLRGVLRATGAEQLVEDMIRARHERALTVLEALPLPGAVRAVLTGLADQTVWRSA
ncbi:polyprenyl synthetase family protein [Streptomyces sp. NPDC004126]|uniref:polyprenyl synthetase family protein n=1 Tax=Streptomyces sp. NPDC004126 TaxID=3390695 RepID=UPI003D07D4AD